MRVVACIGLLALCLGLAGCRLFGKKAATPANPSDQPAAPAPAPKPDPLAPSADAGPGAVPGGGGYDGLVAGRVVDNLGARSPVARVQVVSLEEGAQTTGAPIDVETDGQGYFTIPGLSPGQHYKLVARARDGDHILAGITYVTPPNPKVVIRISEDFASASTPPLPAEPTWPGVKPPAQDNGQAKRPPATLDRPTNPQAGATPGASGGQPQGPAGLGAPRAGAGSSVEQPAAKGSPSWENVVQDGRALATVPPCTVRPPSDPPNGQPPGVGTARAPTCELTGNQLVNFVLTDLDLQPWEFRSRPPARLVLLDFWGTWCGPCQHAIPDLIRLKNAYGPFGLDVIGIAYEAEGSPADQAARVKRVRDRLGVNYRLLLGGGMETCPVKSQFGVQRFPTLVLLDETGHILWQCQGLDEANRLQLEGLLRWHLKLRSY